jgi:hypothetical protein
LAPSAPSPPAAADRAAPAPCSRQKVHMACMCYSIPYQFVISITKLEVGRAMVAIGNMVGSERRRVIESAGQVVHISMLIDSYLHIVLPLQGVVDLEHTQACSWWYRTSAPLWYLSSNITEWGLTAAPHNRCGGIPAALMLVTCSTAKRAPSSVLGGHTSHIAHHTSHSPLPTRCSCETRTDASFTSRDCSSIR